MQSEVQQSALNVVVLVTKLFHRSMTRILTIRQLAVDFDQTRPIYDGNGLWLFIPKRRTRLTHFVVFGWMQYNFCSPHFVRRISEGKKTNWTWTPIKHITKRNHLRIKTKLFRRNRISPKMPFCFCYAGWLIEAIALDSKRSKQLYRVRLLLIPPPPSAASPCIDVYFKLHGH